jgi:Flp pilus assembly protein TadD
LNPRAERLRRAAGRAALALASPLVLLAGAEMTLRALHAGHPTALLVPAPEIGPGVFVENPAYGNAFFPASLARTPAPILLRPKAAGAIRVVVLGESAAMGFPLPEFGLARTLHATLSLRFPSIRWEVVNGTMTAINSHALLDMAQDLCAHEPDVLVVYAGNNEVIGPHGPGTVFGRFTASHALIRLHLTLRRTRIGQSLSALHRLLPRAKGLPKWQGLSEFEGLEIRNGDERLRGMYRHFADNLAGIVRAAQHAGAGVVLCTVAVNLRDWPPLASTHRHAKDSPEFARWRREIAEGDRAVEEGSWDAALQHFGRAREIEPAHADTVFRVAECLDALGRTRDARAAYEEARDLDAYRFRADGEINRIIRRVAAEHNVACADAAGHLSTPGGGAPGSEEFLDHVHLTFDGMLGLAEAIGRTVPAALPRRQSPGAQEQPLRDIARRALFYTEWDEADVASSLIRFRASSLVESQRHHERWTSSLERKKKDAADFIAARGIEDLRRRYGESRTLRPDDWQADLLLGRHLSEMGRREEARAPLERACAAMPRHDEGNFYLGLACEESGDFVRAAEHYRRALRARPYDTTLIRNLAHAEHRLGNRGDAKRWCRRALRIQPGFASAHNLLGILLAEEGRADPAMRQFRLALKHDPNFAEACENLGILRLEQEHFGEAAMDFEQAVTLRPESADLNCKLGLALERLGLTEAAADRYRRAAALDPAFAPAREGIARTAPRTHGTP